MAEEEKKARPQFEIMAITAKQQFLAIVDEKKWNTEIVFALQTMRNNPEIWDKVARENPQSIANAVINIATIGTTLNPALQLAYIIPRSIKVNGVNKMSACLDHSYRGLCQVATNSGGVIDMDADCVYANDYFKYARGLSPVLEHIPCSMRTDISAEQKKAGRGAFMYVYATAILPFGNTRHTKFIVLDKEEVELVRQTSQAPNSPMWTKFFGEGARKTAIKKLYKLLPQTQRMSIAIAELNAFDGLDLEAEKRERKREGESRFQDIEATVMDEAEEPGPDVCPGEGCGKLRILGKCYNLNCALGEPPPDEFGDK